MAIECWLEIGAFQGKVATTPQQTNQTDNVMTKEQVRQMTDQIRQAVAGARLAAAKAATAAQAAGGPGTPTPPPAPREITIVGPDGQKTVVGVPSYNANDVIPPQAVEISIAFFIMVAAIIIGLPLARAFSRRMDRRGGTALIPSEVTSQLAQLNQSVDAIALEVERISEGQRYTTRLLSEQRDASGDQTLPSGERK
jgi:hypothetical protein